MSIRYKLVQTFKKKVVSCHCFFFCLLLLTTVSKSVYSYRAKTGIFHARKCNEWNIRPVQCSWAHQGEECSSPGFITATSTKETDRKMSNQWFQTHIKVTVKRCFKCAIKRWISFSKRWQIRSMKVELRDILFPPQVLLNCNKMVSSYRHFKKEFLNMIIQANITQS